MKFVKFSFRFKWDLYIYIHIAGKTGNSWLKRNSYWKASLLWGCTRKQQKKVGRKNSKAIRTSENIAFFPRETDRYHTWISCKLALISTICLEHQDWKWPSYNFFFTLTFYGFTTYLLVKIDNFKPHRN